MGSGASTPAFAGCDADLVARASELAPKMPDDERIETLNEMLKEFNAEAAAFEEPDAEESYQVLKTTRDGSGIKLIVFDKKNDKEATVRHIDVGELASFRRIKTLWQIEIVIEVCT